MKEKARGKKKRFHWWHIPLGLVLLLIVLIIVLVCLMRSMLPWRNMVSMTSNFQLNLSDGMRAFAMGGERDYVTLPKPLVMEDGTAVETEAQFEERREEILALFEEYVYGTLPEDGFDTSFEVVEQGEALNGAAVRKQVKITISTEKGSSDALMLLYVPNTNQPAPVVIGLNSSGNHAVLDDSAILMPYTLEEEGTDREAERGSKAYRWNIQDSISRGYAVATIYFEDFAPDNKDTYNSRLISLFDEEEFKAIGAWAFGLMRGVDYLAKDADIDAEHIAVVGHSRLGKAAVWAGANDTRIGMVISNDSGNSGASLSRCNHGETVLSINKVFSYWFCSKYAEYGKHEDELPVDQNLLLAAIAPRHLYVASAESDLWSDPQGAWNSLMNAQDAFVLYGLETLPESGTQPDVNTPLWSEAVGYHIRTGWHDMQEDDWTFYLDYMDTYFLN